MFFAMSFLSTWTTGRPCHCSRRPHRQPADVPGYRRAVLRLFLQLSKFAASRIFCTAGSSRPIKMPTMAMTTRSSTSVKPRRRYMRLPGGHLAAGGPARRPRVITICNQDYSSLRCWTSEFECRSAAIQIECRGEASRAVYAESRSSSGLLTMLIFKARPRESWSRRTRSTMPAALTPT